MYRDSEKVSLTEKWEVSYARKYILTYINSIWRTKLSEQKKEEKAVEAFNRYKAWRNRDKHRDDSRETFKKMITEHFRS